MCRIQAHNLTIQWHDTIPRAKRKKKKKRRSTSKPGKIIASTEHSPKLFSLKARVRTLILAHGKSTFSHGGKAENMLKMLFR
jgi:hypothetical protein